MSTLASPASCGPEAEAAPGVRSRFSRGGVTSWLKSAGSSMRPIHVAAPMLALALVGRGEASPLRPGDLALLNRVTWGETETSAAQLAALGSDRWLQQQLHPAPGDHLPAVVQAQIDALPISHTPLTQLVAQMDAQNKAANALTDPDQKKAAQSAYQQAMTALARHAATREILRDIYSP